MEKNVLHKTTGMDYWTKGLNRTISIILVTALIVNFILMCKGVILTIDLNEWRYNEFLINYEGGFVRRGLIGQLLYELYVTFGILPQGVITIVCCIAYAIALGFYLCKFREKHLCWWILVSPFVLGYTDSIIRKDFMLCILMILMMLLVKMERPTFVRRFVAVMIACLAIFIHEAFIFWGVPLFGLYLISQKGQRVVNLLLLFLPLMSFILMSYYKGDLTISHEIIDSWNKVLPNSSLEYNKMSSVGAIGWDIVGTMKFHLKSNFYNNSWSGFFVRPVTMICLYYFFTSFIFMFKGNNTEKTEFSALFLSALFFLLPMFLVLSCDYGRLYQYSTLSTLAAFVIFNKSQIVSMFPNRLLAIISMMNDRLRNFIIPSKGLMIVLLFLLAPCPISFEPIGALMNSLYGTLIRPIAFIINEVIGL